jgi:hypothetical protein
MFDSGIAAAADIGRGGDLWINRDNRAAPIR